MAHVRDGAGDGNTAMVSPARRCRCLRSNDSLTPLAGPAQPAKVPQMPDMGALRMTPAPGSGPITSFGVAAGDFEDCRFPVGVGRSRHPALTKPLDAGVSRNRGLPEPCRGH